MGKTDEELIEEREPIGGLQVLDSWPYKKSIRYRLSFPPQDHRIGEGSAIKDPTTGGSAGTVVEVDDAASTITIGRGLARAGDPLPRSIVPDVVVSSKDLAESLLRTGHWVAANGLGDVDPATPSGGRHGRGAGAAPAGGRPTRGRARALRSSEPGETALEAATRIALTAHRAASCRSRVRRDRARRTRARG